MTSSLRSNVLISTLAMVLVGVTRPAFNAVVNRIFGPEVNGRAAALIALIFLASLPATAALPTVMVRHVSRALGAGRKTEASGHARIALIWTLILASVGAAGALIDAQLFRAGMEARDMGFVLEGVLSYSLWRTYRTLLLAIGQMPRSIAADVAGVLGMAVLLSAFVMLRRPELAVQAFLSVYVVYALLTTTTVLEFARDGSIDETERRSFTRYNVLWFIGTASSLAARELALLILDARASKAVVGELSVALSFLTMLAFAPRIIELPLVHELSLLGGREDRTEQVKLTDKALDWLWVVMLGGGFGAAILAPPILSIGDVHTPEIVLSFVLVTFAFSSEMVMTPATNLLITESDPRILTWIGAGSLLAAFLFWYSPWCTGTVGVVVGLAISFVVKGVAIGGYAWRRFGVRLVRAPLRKGAAAILGTAAVIGVLGGSLNPWLAAAIFEAALCALCAPTLREMLSALMDRTGRS